MKEAMGGLGLTQIVIFFLVVFAGYISISINSNRAYKVKDEVISIIQKNNGFDEKALSQIQDYMSSVGYRTTANCSALNSDSSGGKDWRGYTSSGTSSTSRNNALFCIRPMVTSYDSGSDLCPQFPTTAYYQVKLFFALDIPILNQIFKFQVTGTTKKLYYPKLITDDIPDSESYRKCGY